MKKIIAVGNTKGGVGKTTTAVHLADWLHKVKGDEVVFINASFQTGVHDWLDELEISYYQEKDPDELYALAESIDADYVVIDLPGASEIVREVLDYCDFMLTPVQPSALDLKDGIKMINIVHRKRKLRKNLHAAFFLSLVDLRSNAAGDAQAYFNKHKVNLLDTKIRRLKLIRDSPLILSTAFRQTDAASKLVAHEYESLFKEFFANA